MGFNEVVIEGRVKKAPETKHFQSGSSVTKFAITVYNGKKSKDPVVYNKKTWIDVEAWGYAGKDAAKLAFDQDVIVKGEWLSEHWDDKETGKPRIKHYINCSDVALYTRLPKDGAAPQPASKKEDYDDIAF